VRSSPANGDAFDTSDPRGDDCADRGIRHTKAGLLRLRRRERSRADGGRKSIAEIPEVVGAREIEKEQLR